MDENDKKQYNRYVEKVTPTHSVVTQMVKAFAVGGCVCVLGQIIYNIAIFYWHLDKTSASTWCSLILIFISVLLTATGLYPKITKFAGAGLLVPITGFANSVAAAAIEFKKEGQVFGVGAKIFTIAGPVILYGILSSSALGFIYWLGNCLGWW